MTTDLRSLLTEVAEGRLDPAEAARTLESEPAPAPAAEAAGPAAGSGPGAATDATQTSPETSAETGAETNGDSAPASTRGASQATADHAAAAPGQSRADEPTGGPDATAADQLVRRVVVRITARSVRVVGDVTVGTATVEGPHSVRREGADLVVGAPESAEPGSYAYEQRSQWSRLLAGSSAWGTPLTVRVNPLLPVDVEVTAGSLRVSGLHAPLGVRLTAGSLVAADCSGPVQGVVRAGSARLDTRPEGTSALRVETGSVDLRLLPGSDVRVTSRVQLGEVVVRAADGTVRKLSPEGSDEAVVGAGTNAVDLDVVMGSVKVTLP